VTGITRYRCHPRAHFIILQLLDVRTIPFAAFFVFLPPEPFWLQSRPARTQPGRRQSAIATSFEMI
jgi:hypothetical protein